MDMLELKHEGFVFERKEDMIIASLHGVKVDFEFLKTKDCFKRLTESCEIFLGNLKEFNKFLELSKYGNVL